MAMGFEIDSIIYGYMFICLALLGFNLVYILRDKQRSKRRIRLCNRWEQALRRQLERLAAGQDVEGPHLRELERRLVRLDPLIAYNNALEACRQTDAALLAAYMAAILPALQSLALSYRSRDSMERAFFAYCIAQNPPCSGEEYRPIMDTLLSYLDDSTVYCRENVLQALCALGNGQAVENLLDRFHAGGWFHHRKLLSDGLQTFRGDKEALAARLWQRRGQWNINLVVAVMEFISGCSPAYQAPFCALLADEAEELELRLAAMRYFRRYPYAPALPHLLACLGPGAGDTNLAIVAASVLDKYPDPAVVQAIKAALSHPNWYVRYNAAGTLVALKPSRQDFYDILLGKDRYAKEVLAYRLRESDAGRRHAHPQ